VVQFFERFLKVI